MMKKDYRMMKIVWAVLGIIAIAFDVRGSGANPSATTGDGPTVVQQAYHAVGQELRSIGEFFNHGAKKVKKKLRDELEGLNDALQQAATPLEVVNSTTGCLSALSVDTPEVAKLKEKIALVQTKIANIEEDQYLRLKNSARLAEDLVTRGGHLVIDMYNKKAGQSQEIKKVAIQEKIKSDRLERQAPADRAETTKRLKYGLAGLTASSLLIMGAYFCFTHYFKERPQIIRPPDTSISFWPKKAVYPISRLDKLILSPALQESVMQKFQGMEFAITQGLPLSNMLFYGPPGVGKSLAAQEFVRSLSDKKLAHHIIIRGPAFQQFARPGQAVSAIRAIFEAAEYSYKKTKKPTIIVFEEAEILFADRGKLAISTEMSRSTLTTLLGLINESTSDHIAFIATTNHKNDLDPAFRDRVHISNHILFDAPEQEEREIFLHQYLNDVLVEKGFVVSNEVMQAIPVLAQSIAGLSGRQISGMIAQAIYPLLNSGKFELTLSCVNKIIEDTMAKKKSV